MILHRETIEKFGYEPSSLKPQSNKTILVQCDNCGFIKERKFQSAQGKWCSNCKSTYQKTYNQNKYEKEYKGKRYGKLVLLNRTTEVRGKRHLSFWECLCDCGKTTKVGFSCLLSGNTKTCGCSQGLTGKNNKSWKGHGEISGEYWNNLKYGAKNRGISFSIDIKEIWDLFLKQNRRCSLTGVDLKFWSSAATRIEQTASLDRINSSKGYSIDNLRWVHKDINTMKMDMSDKEFIDICHLVSRFNKPLDILDF